MTKDAGYPFWIQMSGNTLEPLDILLRRLCILECIECSLSFTFGGVADPTWERLLAVVPNASAECGQFVSLTSLIVCRRS